MIIKNAHDIFFKNTFTDKKRFKALLNGTMPKEILKNLDLSKLTIDPNSYVSEKLKENYSDLVYNCPYKKREELKIALLFEHKSYHVNYPHYQLLDYNAKINELRFKQNQKPVPVIGTILYHGTRKWKVRKFRDYFKDLDPVFYRFIPEFDYNFIDLSSFSNKEIKDGVFKNVSLEIALLIMKNIFNKNELEKHLKDFLEIGREYFEQEEGLKFLESVIRYISIAELKPEKVVNTISEISEKGGELAMSMASVLMEKGKIEGKIEGKREGKKEGKRIGERSGEKKGVKRGKRIGLTEGLQFALDIKFGTKGRSLMKKINEIDDIRSIKKVKTIIKRAKTIEEIENNL